MEIKYVNIDNLQVYLTHLPKEIIEEIEYWKIKCDEIKNHPLAFLKLHENAGSNFNAYQLSLPTNLIDNSFWLAYTLRMGASILKLNHRNLCIRKYNGHFDGYDCWINYSYKGNSNPIHSHGGILSGVIYLTNEDETVFPQLGIAINGNKGDMIIFPSEFQHKVNVQQNDYERITFAFNIGYQDQIMT